MIRWPVTYGWSLVIVDGNAQRNALERGAFLWHCRVVHLVKHKMSHEGLEDKEEEEFFSFLLWHHLSSILLLSHDHEGL